MIESQKPRKRKWVLCKRRKSSFIGKRIKRASGVVSSAPPPPQPESSSLTRPLSPPPTNPSNTPPHPLNPSSPTQSPNHPSIITTSVDPSSSDDPRSSDSVSSFSASTVAIQSNSTPDQPPRRKMLSYKEQEEVRTTIKVLFQRRFHPTYSNCQLPDVAKEISEMMVYPEIKNIKNVIKEVNEALDNDCEYSAKRKKFTKEENRKIQPGSFEEHLCTTFMENGNSYASTTKIFNSLIQAPLQLSCFGITTIYNAIQHTNHLVCSTSGIQQTNKSNQFHRQACYNWFRQLLGRMGEGTTVPPEEEAIITKRFKSERDNKEKIEEEGLTIDFKHTGW